MNTEMKTSWMRRFRLREGLMALGLVSAALVVPGCFVETSHSNVCGDSQITVGWVVTGNGNSLSCAQAGVTEVDIRVDTDQMIAPFDCNAHVGTTPLIAGGVNHDVSLALLDSAGNVVSFTPDRRVFVPCDTNTDLGNIELSLTP
jgi:hypothetical protein